MEKPQSIELDANFEGGATELLFSRLRTEKIRTQIIDLLFQGEQSQIGTFVQSVDFDENNKPIVKEKVPFVPKTKEELERWYEETINRIESVTEIDFSRNSHDLANVETIFIGAISPWSGKPFTSKQMSIIEAHEKGHVIREYVGSFFDDYFSDVIDLTNVTFGPDDIKMYKKALRPENQDKSDEEIKTGFFEYLSQPMEVAERMSQLKNYFGMKADDVFTKAHLDYARVHYIQDTDMDNGMRQFFQAITPEKEERFLDVINSAGI